MEIRWNLQKNEALKKLRGVSFEELLQSKLIGIKKHPKRSDQKIMFFEFRKYVWVVPYVIHGEEMFLKTLFPSRKLTKIYRQGGVL